MSVEHEAALEAARRGLAMAEEAETLAFSPAPLDEIAAGLRSYQRFAGKMLPIIARALLATEGAREEWKPIETAPKDGTRFWGKVGDDAIAMLWHAQFKEFVSSWRQMAMHNGWTFEDGSKIKDHSPVVHKPTHWQPRPSPPLSSGNR